MHDSAYPVRAVEYRQGWPDRQNKQCVNQEHLVAAVFDDATKWDPTHLRPNPEAHGCSVNRQATWQTTITRMDHDQMIAV